MENANMLTLDSLYKMAEEKETSTQEQPDSFDEFMYGFDSTPSLVQNFGLMLEAKLPIGELQVLGEDGIVDYKSPDELYGKGFSDLSYDDRRKVLLTKRNQDLQKEYPELSNRDEDSIATIIGDFIAPFADPTIVVAPAATSIKGIAAVAGALGTGYSMVDDLAIEGEVDPRKALAVGALSAAGGAAVGKVVKTISNKVKIKKDAKALQEANQKVDQIQDAMDEALLDNVPKSEISKHVREKTGFTAEEMVEASARADHKPNYKEPTGYDPGGLNRESKENIRRFWRNGIAKRVVQQTDRIAGRGTPNDITVPGNVAVSRTKNPILDNLLGTLSTRIKKHSPKLFLKVRQHDYNVHQRIYDGEQAVLPLVKALRQVPKQAMPKLSVSLANGDIKTASRILEEYSVGGSTALNQTRGFLDNMYKDLTDVGYKVDKIKNYFPRLVKDYGGLLDAIDAPRRSMIEKALYLKTKQIGVNSIKDIPEEIRSDVINKVVRGFVPKHMKGGLSFTKNRKLPEVTEEISSFYYSPVESLERYIKSTANDIERRKFFGRNAVNTDATKIDTELSVGNLIDGELQSGNISPSGADEVGQLLNGRFGMGEVAPGKSIRFIRDLGYGTTLANPYSALTQIGDIGVSAYANGMRNTIAALFGKNKINMEELGLDNLVANELGNVLDASSFLDKALYASGFKKVDKIGKNNVLNAALRKANALSKSDNGVAKLARKYKEAMGDEFDMLINELKSGEMSDRVKFYLWNELADLQPISLSEMPLSYLNSPNGRILYSLKSFTIKQLDVLRRDVIQEYKAGNKLEAGKNLLRYLTIVPLTGATVDEVKDVLLGRGFELNDITEDNYFENVTKLVGVNDYTRSMYLKRGDVSGFVTNTLAPPLSTIDAIYKDMDSLVTSGDVLPENVIKELPVGGKIWYNFFGGGLENWEKWNKE
jgi:hypothetical protein